MSTFAAVRRQAGLRKAMAAGVASVHNSWVYWSGRLAGRRVTPAGLAVGPSPAAIVERTPPASREAPRISVVMSVGGAEPRAVAASFRSLLAQSSDLWELCVCDDGSREAPLDVLASYREADARFRIVPPGYAGCAAEAVNLAAEQASGEVILLLACGDELHSEAVARIAAAWAAARDADLLYVDEAHREPDGESGVPPYKPDWAPSYLESMMYLGRGFAVRKSLFWRLGGMRVARDGAHEYDLALRISRVARRVVHVPRDLVRRGGSGGDRDDGWTDAAAAFAAVSDYAAGLEPPASARDGLLPGTFRVRRELPSNLRVSLVVPTADALVRVDGRGELRMLANLLRSVAAAPVPRGAGILVVDDGELSAESIAAIEALGASRLSYSDPLRAAAGFSFARKVNWSVARTESEYVILLNDDLEVRTAGWIDALLEPLMDAGVGVVGARLLYPDSSIQHGGLVVGVQGGAVHCFRGLPAGQVGYGRSTHVIREFSAVTGAVMAFRRSTFNDLGGFDEVFPCDYQDVDFCARVLASGLRVVYTPFAEFTHFEGKTFRRPPAGFEREESLFRLRWAGLMAHDPSYNPNLPKDRPDHKP
jgi:cellulose synthase/poly-beta-1,6-N-acetylglucosamine synthase-like glycosyltransferase